MNPTANHITAISTTTTSTAQRRTRRLGALTFTAALALAACGSDDTTSSDTTATTGAPAEEPATAMDDDAASSMTMAEMNMGNADVVPADQVEGAALARGEFALLDTRPAGYDDVAGTAVIARSDAGTTVSTEISGLLPNVTYISHVHESPCSDNGGAHFQFVDGTVEVPPNEIHLMFTSDNDGEASWSAENVAVATADAVAFVVHPLEFIDNKVACVDFIADSADAIAAAISSGPIFDSSSIEGMDGMNMNNMDMGETDMGETDNAMNDMNDMDDMDEG